jgi:CheY-like chemotaxis protein
MQGCAKMARKVIVADDNEDVRGSVVDFIEDVCKKEDIYAEFDQVPDGKDLVEKVLTGNYDLVLTDNEMIEVSGLRAIIDIRKQNKTVPIYMLSSSGVGEKALKLGANGYFDKEDYHGFEAGILEVIKKHLK